MTFDDVIDDIEKMVGLELKSIKKGANLTLLGIDKLNKRIDLVTSTGKTKTRPVTELKKIWDCLCLSTAAHVDTVLGGSGSSRNQPETIMANLPYIEWFLLDGKKHLALVKEHTHEYGTLQKMDDIKSVGIKEKFLKSNNTESEIVVITEDIRLAANTYEKINGLTLKPVSPGIYEQFNDKVKVTLVSSNVINESVEPGTYVVARTNIISNIGRPIKINENQYTIISESGLKYLIPSSDE